MHARSVLGNIRVDFDDDDDKVGHNSHVSATSSRQSEGGAVGDTGRNVLAEDDAWSQKGGGDERDGEVEHFLGNKVGLRK
jgi:hypothetical protein